MMACVTRARHQQIPGRPSTSAERTVGGHAVVERVGGSPPNGPASPPARRLTRPSWRDPRLLVGTAIVAGSVLVGAQVLASADDTVAVWSSRSDLAAGTPLTVDDLERSELRFGSEALAQRYLPGAEDPPAGLVLVRDVAAGELVPRSALGAVGTEDVAELPVAVASEAVPAGLRPGERVDVWVTRPAGSGQGREAVRVLERVRVTAVPRSASALGPAATRQVVVAVPWEDGLLARALADLADGDAVLVRRG
jgi:hypothetical protein